MKKVNSLRFSPKDNVAVALEAAEAGGVMEFEGNTVVLQEPLSRGFKAALRPLHKGEKIIKYGEEIGVAAREIRAGEHVHCDNIASALTGELHAAPWSAPRYPEAGAALPDFYGYKRKNGRVGIRNELWLIPTVGCINGLLRAAVKAFPLPEGITAVRVLEHPWGCSQLGGDLENTRKVLAALAHNPNAAGVLMASLGCENLEPDSMSELLSDVENLRTVVLQQEDDDFAAIHSALCELAKKARTERTLCPGSSLVFGIKCGGSDALSGITANPLVGRVTDAFTAAGASVVMGEIPEIFGAEKGLLARCATPQVHEALVRTLRSFRDYFTGHGQPVFENPSPGNKAGGISTLEEKSLGAVSKSGHSVITEVLGYGERLSEKGLSVVCCPGNDLVSSTAMAAAGAVMILFTTGRGTPFGTVVPTLKIATNSALAAKKAGWTDFDASRVITEGMEPVVSALIEKMMKTASGAETRSEELGIADISIFKDGVIL